MDAAKCPFCFAIIRQIFNFSLPTPSWAFFVATFYVRGAQPHSIAFVGIFPNIRKAIENGMKMARTWHEHGMKMIILCIVNINLPDYVLKLLFCLELGNIAISRFFNKIFNCLSGLFRKHPLELCSFFCGRLP